MTPEEYNQRLRQTMTRIVDQNAFINAMFGKCGSSEAFVHEIAEQQISDWARGVLHGKPPWHKGRGKTRGGRDQDRWRKRHKTVKIMRERKTLRYRNIEDYCRANGIEFRRFIPDRCDVLGGTLQLTDNQTCDFVKGGQS